MSFLLSGMILAICWQLIVTFAALGQLVVKLGLSSWHACPHSFSFTAFCCSNFGLELRLNGALIHAVRSWASPFGVPLVPENWLTTIINVKSEQVFVRHACSAPPKKGTLRNACRFEIYSDILRPLSHQPWNSVTHRPLRWRGCLHGTMVGDSPQQAKRHNCRWAWHLHPWLSSHFSPLKRPIWNPIWYQPLVRVLHSAGWEKRASQDVSLTADDGFDEVRAGNKSDLPQLKKLSTGFVCSWMSLLVMTWYSGLHSH